jgi:sucrose-phosphate synthase
MYIQLLSVHGLLRSRDIEMGRNADTGGQVRYVVELAQQLSELPEVEAVDLFTRRIRDRRVSPDYGRPTERINDKCRIVRLACGGGRYIRKERLWPFLDEFVDNLISFTRREGRRPTVVHGHYADAGYVAKEVAAAFGVPFIFTGHSLGKPKLEYLQSEGWTHEEANRELAIDHRIQVEQECLMAADLIVTSTRHERDVQYAGYPGDPSVRFEVIPPGTDLERFFPYYEYDMPSTQVNERFKQARVRMINDLGRFHLQADRPLILALCRPDRRKNIGALIEAYGESRELQAIANLAVFAGIRKDIGSMPDNEQRVLTDMLLAMDRYDLYGKMAIPKNHGSEFDVPELYRIAASSRGVFVNTAFIELFGLTAIEASAAGLPFVVTENGGPQDIVENCRSGLIVNVNDRQQLTDAMIRLLTDADFWDRCSNNGINRVREHYTWKRHCQRYLECVRDVLSQRALAPAVSSLPTPTATRLESLESLLICDIDDTLLGDDDALAELKQIVAEHRPRMGFGVASGRGLELVDEALSAHGLMDVDIVISSVGSEIYYGADRRPDKGWAAQLRSTWKPERIRAALDPFPFLSLQAEPYTQRDFKISYNLDASISPDEALHRIREALTATRVAYSLIFSRGTFVDILPHRASKGKAVRYLSAKWQIPLKHVVTAGDSGNDRDMLLGRTAAIVVGNHAEDLADLKQLKSSRIYFADAHCAAGIIEGLSHYGLIAHRELAES